MSETVPSRLEDLLGHADWVRRLARRLVADPNVADDIVQETFLAAVRGAPAESSNLRGWLHRATANAARRWGRTSARRRTRELVSGEGKSAAAPSTADLVQRTAAQRAVVDAVLRLDERSRDILLLRYYAELDSNEIAERLGIPAATVRTCLARALAELRVRMAAEYGEGEWRSIVLPLALGGLGAAPAPSSSASLTSLHLLGVLLVSSTAKLLIGLFSIVVLGFLTFVVTHDDGGEETIAPDGSIDSASTGEDLPRRSSSKSADGTASPESAASIESAATRPLEAATAASTASNFVVRGRVVATDRTPLGGAAVYAAESATIVDLQRTFQTLHALYFRESSFKDPSPHRVATTAEDGSFEFNLDHPVADLTVAACRPDFGAERASGIEVGKSTPRAPIEIVVERGVSFFGMVVSTTGEPIPRAIININGFTSNGRTVFAYGETDESGNYRTFPTPIEKAHASVDVEGWFDDYTKVVVDAGTFEKRVDFRLDPATKIAGKLTAKDGGKLDLIRALDPFRTKGDEAGLRRGGAALRLVASSFDPKTMPIVASMYRTTGALNEHLETYAITLRSKDDRFLVVLLGDRVLGYAECEPRVANGPDIVIDLERLPTPAATADLTVSAHRRGGERLASFAAKLMIPTDDFYTTIDKRTSDGGSGDTVVFKGIKTGRIWVTASAPGFSPVRRAVDLTPGSQEIVVELSAPESELSGLIVDALGKPVNGAKVTLVDANGQPIQPARPSKDATGVILTNEAGRFQASGLPSGDIVALIAAPEFGRKSTRLTLKPGSNDLGTITLAKGVVVHVSPRCRSSGPFNFRIYDASGLILEDFDIAVQRSFGGASFTLEPGDYRIEIDCLHHETWRGPLTVREAMEFEPELSPKER